MTSFSTTNASQDSDTRAQEAPSEALPCVLCFNANDPVGGGGLSGDALVVGSIGGHALPVATGTYLRDSRDTVGHAALDDALVAEQARLVAEDAPVQTIKVGFVGSPESLAVVAAFASDYASVPVITYLPDLSWWTDHEIDSYLEACRDLLLPQTAVLVGNNTTLRHWLLPESITDRYTRPVDLARAAADLGVSYVLVTGVSTGPDQISNVLASPQAELVSHTFERIDANFMGAGDTLSAALAALLATGSELTTATTEALEYLDQALDHGFRPGMGRALPDRLFWAESDEGDTSPPARPDDIIDIPHPPNETKH